MVKPTKPKAKQAARAKAKPKSRAKAKTKAKPSAKAKPKSPPAKAKTKTKTKAKAAPKAKAERSEAETETIATKTHAALEAAWSRWGTLERDVIAHMINPSFMGGPRWPGMRQAYRVALAGNAVLIASDGLADPFDAGHGPADTNGLGLELFAVTTDAIARAGVGDQVTRFGATWLHDLVFQCAHLAADHGGLAALLDELGALTSEIHDVKIPASHVARFVNAEGRVGVLLAPGFAKIPPRIAGPLGPIRLVHVQLLTLDELAAVVAGGEPVRKRLVAELAGKVSSLDRPSCLS